MVTVLALALAATACGTIVLDSSDGETSITTTEAPPPCVPPTTVPGETASLPDPDACDLTVATSTSMCDEAPLVKPTVDFWIDGEANLDFEQTSEVVADDVDFDWLDRVPTGGLVVAATETRSVRWIYCSPDGTSRAEGRLEHATFELGDGRALEVDVRQLVEPVDSFDMATDSDPIVLEEGGQIIRSDLFGDGSLRTVWLVRPDGLMAKVRALGIHAPNVSGWPTTLVDPPGPNQPGEAPLSLDELETIARAIVGWPEPEGQ